MTRSCDGSTKPSRTSSTSSSRAKTVREVVTRAPRARDACSPSRPRTSASLSNTACNKRQSSLETAIAQTMMGTKRRAKKRRTSSWLRKMMTTKRATTTVMRWRLARNEPEPASEPSKSRSMGPSNLSMSSTSKESTRVETVVCKAARSLSSWTGKAMIKRALRTARDISEIKERRQRSATYVCKRTCQRQAMTRRLTIYWESWIR